MLNSRRKVLWHCGQVAFTSSPSAGVVTGAERTTFTLAITGFFSSTLCSSLCAAKEFGLVNLEGTVGKTIVCEKKTYTLSMFYKVHPG